MLSKQTIKQFISYFSVGLAAALVEWFTFWLCNSTLILNVYFSTTTAFLIATATNWLLGRKSTFKAAAAKKKASHDFIAVFLASGVGYAFNLLLMWLFTDVLTVMPILAKIAATGIVFFWNFTSRKYIVYRVRSGD